MSVISVKPSDETERARFALESGDEYEIVFVVRADSDIAPYHVAAAIADPILNATPFTLGQVYSWKGVTDPTSLLHEIVPERIGPRQWNARLTFRPLQDAGSAAGKPPQESDPFVRLPEINWSKQKREKVCWKAWRRQDDGTWEIEPVVNSAGGLFAQPYMRDASRSVLHYARAEHVFPQGWVLLYQEAMNSTPFLGWPAYHVVCESIQGSYKAEKVGNAWVKYWWVAYEFIFDPEGWFDDLLDAGGFFLTEESVGNPGDPNYAVVEKKELPRDKNGVPFGGVVLLDGHGRQLSDDKAKAGEVVYRTYSNRKEADFGPMRIVIPY